MYYFRFESKKKSLHNELKNAFFEQRSIPIIFLLMYLQLLDVFILFKKLYFLSTN